MESVLAHLREESDRTLEAIQLDMGAIRTGRASAHLLDGVRVDYYGTLTPLNQVANISVPEARLITVQPWESGLVEAIMKVIQKSDLGLNPSTDGTVIRIPFPALTEDRRKDLVKQVNRIGEEGKVSIRNHRHAANDTLKKMEKDKELAEDLMHKGTAQVQKITDEYTEKIDEMVVRKDADVMEV